MSAQQFCDQHTIAVRYTNWRGETRIRRVVPLRIFWGKSPFHEGEQWFMECHDVEHGYADRHFALKDCDFSAVKSP